jgi:hypothetical protein
MKSDGVQETKLYIYVIIGDRISFKLLRIFYAFAMIFTHSYLLFPRRELNEHLRPKSHMAIRHLFENY